MLKVFAVFAGGIGAALAAYAITRPKKQADISTLIPDTGTTSTPLDLDGVALPSSIGDVLQILNPLENDDFRLDFSGFSGFDFSLPTLVSAGTDDTYERAKEHVILREGLRYDVYKDTLGKLTVGYGHLVTTSDNLKFGDTITEAQARAFLDKDLKKAFNAAKSQAAQIGQGDNKSFIVALTSVNFQLGTGWRSKFPTAWRHLKNGNYTLATQEILYTRAGSGVYSSWYQQTPTRVMDFVNAINNLKGVSV